jgi:hypothetical protein
MASLAAFVFLVVVPIWSIATILVRWIESWEVPPDIETTSPAELSHRLALLEQIVKSDQAEPARSIR